MMLAPLFNSPCHTARRPFAAAHTPRIAMIDDFVADEKGYSHGQSLEKQMKSSDSSADVVRFNVDKPGQRRGQRIAQSLMEIARRAERGERFDAVNLSQEDFTADAETEAINQAITFLQNRYGIPVVVAAGNKGADKENALARTAALRVESSKVGQDGRADTSGLGTIRSEGEFTSQATANVTLRLAQLRARGMDALTAMGTLKLQSIFEGGSLDRRKNYAPPTGVFAALMQAVGV